MRHVILRWLSENISKSPDLRAVNPDNIVEGDIRIETPLCNSTSGLVHPKRQESAAKTTAVQEKIFVFIL